METQRATFVKNAFRYAISDAPSVLVDEPSAREIIIDANTDEVTAGALADAYLDETRKLPLAFDISIEGIVTADDFVDHPPLFYVTLPRYSIPTFRVFRAISASPDHLNGRTKLRVRA